MSMSSLSAQLAMLNGAVGGNVPTRRKEDAIGRGIHHSAMHGHSVYGSEKSARFKPSVLHSHSKAAADIPLTQLLSNCTDAMSSLTHLSPLFHSYTIQLFSPTSINFERGLQTPTQNTKTDQTINSLLHLLSPLLSSHPQTLHVIEYLLRRYDIHIRPSTADTLLLTALPYHHLPLFTRILHLLDLATISNGIWVFLRPYASKHCPPPDRLPFSKQISKNKAFLSKILSYFRTQIQNWGNSSPEFQKGIRSILAFLTVILLKGLDIQFNNHGTLEEQTVRILLPYVQIALREKKCNDAIRWGYIMISTLVEKCNLKKEAKQLIMNSIFEGLSQKSDSMEDVELVCDGIISFLTLLEDDDGEGDGYLGIQEGGVVGCDLAETNFRQMSKLKMVSYCLGQLWMERGVNVKNLIAGMMAMAVKDMIQGEEEKTKEDSFEFLQRLLKEPNLQSLFITKTKNSTHSTSLITLLTNHILKTFAKHSHSQSYCHTILKILKQLDSTSLDAGVAYTIGTIKSKRKKKLNEILEGICSVEDETDLPVSVGLEHPEDEIRMKAIRKLIKEEGSDESKSRILLNKFCQEQTAEVANAFFEGFLSLDEKEEPTIENAMTAMEKWGIGGEVGTIQISNKKKKRKSTSSGDKISLTTEEVETICYMLQMCGMVIQQNQLLNEKKLHHLFMCVVAHCNIKSKKNDETKLASRKIQEQAAKVIIEAFRGSQKEYTLHEAREILATEQICRDVFAKTVTNLSSADPKQVEIQKTFIWTVLSSCFDYLQQETQIETKRKIANTVLTATTELLNQNLKLDEEQTNLLLETIKTSFDHKFIQYFWKQTFNLLTNLASADPSLFETIGLPTIQHILQTTKTKHPSSSQKLLLFETAIRPDSPTTTTTRLLDILLKLNDSSPVEELLPTLALLCHPDESIRSSGLEMLTNLTLPSSLSSFKKVASSATKTNILMDGQNALPQFLHKSFSKSSSKETFTKELMKCCASLACGYKWLGVEHAIGGCYCVTLVLNAMEGCSAFSLREKWEFGANDILNTYWEAPNWNDRAKPMLECIIKLLKGVVLKNSEHVVIDLKGRSRSYSIGAEEDAMILDPYPDEMAEAIVQCLSSDKRTTRQFLCDMVLKLVVGRPSWADNIYPKLNAGVRRCIASLLLGHRAEGNDEAGLALMNLSLGCLDLIEMLKQQSMDLLAVTVLCDCVRGRAKWICENETNVSDLTQLLFDLLLKLSTISDNDMEIDGPDDEGSDYTRFCLVQTLYSLYQSMNNNTNTSSSDQFVSHSTLLVALLSPSTDTQTFNSHQILPFSSRKPKTTCLSLLTLLCSRAPNSVVHSLLPALTQILASGAGSEAMTAILPAYCTHAHKADLNFVDFVQVLILQSSSSKHEEKMMLFRGVVKAFGSMEKGEKGLASLLSCYFALKAYEICVEGKYAKKEEDGVDLEEEGVSEEDLLSMVLQVLQFASPEDQIGSLLTLLQNVGKLMMILSKVKDDDDGMAVDEELKTEGAAVDISISELVHLALCGSNEPTKSVTIPSKFSAPQLRSLMWLTTNILSVVKEGLSSPTAKNVIRRSEVEANLCLRLWQHLLHIQTSSIHASQQDHTDLERDFWEAARISTNHCLSFLQKVLPMPHFLASVTALLKEEDVDGNLRKKALKLLSNRASEVDPSSPEAELVLESIPDLTQLVTRNGGDRRVVVVQQSALLAIERIAQSLCLPGGMKILEKSSVVLLPAMENIVDLLAQTEGNLRGKKGIDEVEGQLFSSAALCSATLIAILKARCLPLLPKLVQPLVSSLTMVNSIQKDISNNLTDEHEREDGLFVIFKLLQQSILRGLLAITETLPQFLLPYHNSLLAPTAIPSSIMRQDDEVKIIVERLDSSLATKTPARQLIPALTTALSNCLDLNYTQEAQAILSILKSCLQSSIQPEIIPSLNQILSALILTYDRTDLLPSANATLVSLIMKLSESQLRPLYARFREWKGELEDSESGMKRRFAFWTMSAMLGKELRGIFLPCLSSVLGDAVEELEYAVDKLCPSKSSKEGQKRRRLSDEQPVKVETLTTLQPLLLCLELALKADAREGGNWTRADDNQRYNLILSPISKLLQAKIPDDFPVMVDIGEEKTSSASSSFQKLVQGVGTAESGNVINCLTALAVAAGDEQLWKPLNYAMVRACGDERAEVRKAGVSALLSIMQALGEEYMVLLPECLPALSELLEDGDEEIERLTKECVSVAEDVLGESLEDSLK